MSFNTVKAFEGSVQQSEFSPDNKVIMIDGSAKLPTPDGNFLTLIELAVPRIVQPMFETDEKIAVVCKPVFSKESGYKPQVIAAHTLNSLSKTFTGVVEEIATWPPTYVVRLDEAVMLSTGQDAAQARQFAHVSEETRVKYGIEDGTEVIGICSMKPNKIGYKNMVTEVLAINPSREPA